MKQIIKFPSFQFMSPYARLVHLYKWLKSFQIVVSSYMSVTLSNQWPTFTDIFYKFNINVLIWVTWIGTSMKRSEYCLPRFWLLFFYMYLLLQILCRRFSELRFILRFVSHKQVRRSLCNCERVCIWLTRRAGASCCAW